LVDTLFGTSFFFRHLVLAKHMDTRMFWLFRLKPENVGSFVFHPKPKFIIYTELAIKSSKSFETFRSELNQISSDQKIHYSPPGRPNCTSSSLTLL
jgi:hypothetical protein